MGPLSGGLRWQCGQAEQRAGGHGGRSRAGSCGGPSSVGILVRGGDRRGAALAPTFVTAGSKARAAGPGPASARCSRSGRRRAPEAQASGTIYDRAVLAARLRFGVVGGRVCPMARVLAGIRTPRKVWGRKSRRGACWAGRACVSGTAAVEAGGVLGLRRVASSVRLLAAGQRWPRASGCLIPPRLRGPQTSRASGTVVAGTSCVLAKGRLLRQGGEGGREGRP